MSDLISPVMPSSDGRATCWSITINNPKASEYSGEGLPGGWKLFGQLEKGAEGTLHFQGMLKTPQVRFAAVKKALPRAHIEIARDPQRLAKYVKKSETRVQQVQTIPNIFEYQTIICSRFVKEDCDAYIARRSELVEAKETYGQMFLKYIDTLVEADIKRGQRGAEYMAMNPMWRNSWSHFGPAIIERYNIEQQNAAQDAEERSQEESSVCGEGEEQASACPLLQKDDISIGDDYQQHP